MRCTEFFVRAVISSIQISGTTINGRTLVAMLKKAGLTVIEERDISANILQSLELNSEQQESLVKRYAPKIFQKEILNFTGSKGTATYENFLTGKFTYKSFKIRIMEICPTCPGTET